MTGSERRLVAILFTDIVGYTALVGSSESRGIEARDEHRRLVQTLATQFHGEFVDESGDASLAIFPSAVDAVKCAMAIQAVLAANPVFQVRAGIHVGDVVERDGRLIGDGINVASRLPALAEPGGIVATDLVVEHLRNQNIATTALGNQNLKNVSHPVSVFSVGGNRREEAQPSRSRGRIVGIAAAVVVALMAGWLFLLGGADDLVIASFRLGLLPSPEDDHEKEIAFTHASDGVRIAYATTGNPSGPPVVVVLGWATHIERGFNPWSHGLLDTHRVVLYDGRGTGLSDRGVEDLSLGARVRDLEAVVRAAGLDRFGILAVSAGGLTTVAYTAKHPERVSRIAFYGSFLCMGADPKQYEIWKSLPPLVRTSWGSDNPAFRQLFTNLFFPDGNDLMLRFFNEFQRIAMEPTDAANFIVSMLDVDVRPLAAEVEVPVLVVHRRGDLVVPYTLGRDIAARIPRAKLVGMDGNNHAPSPEEREALDELSALMQGFFADAGPMAKRTE